MMEMITLIYRIICIVALLILVPFIIKWFKIELNARKDRYEREKEEMEAQYRNREYPFPDVYYRDLRITSFIVVPRLPNPYAEEIQKLIHNGIGFILEAEYLSIIKDAPNFTTMSYNVFCYVDKMGPPVWKQYDEHSNSSYANIGHTYHTITEIWSLLYLNYKETGDIPENERYVYTRTLPDHIKDAIDNATKRNKLHQYTNHMCLVNPTYHHIIKVDEK